MQEAGLQASLMKERQGAVAGQAVERRPPAGRKLGLFPHFWLPGPSCKPRGRTRGGGLGWSVMLRAGVWLTRGASEKGVED